MSEKAPGLLALVTQLQKEGASDRKITEAVDNYIERNARRKGIPIRGLFELTPLCNLDCKMCYVHLTPEQVAVTERKLLTTAQWKHIMAEAIEAGMIEALLTGGEAMLHPGFDELYLFLQEKGVKVSVKTNGLLLTEERMAFFKQHPPARIEITLYGSNDETYEKVTGHRCFEKVLAGIQRAKESGIHLQVGITPSCYMMEDAEALMKTLHSMNVQINIGMFLMQPRTETGRAGHVEDLSLDEYIQLLKLRAKVEGFTLQKMSMEDVPMPNGGNGQPKFGLHCAAGYSSFDVRWDGTMTPCMDMDDIEGVNLLTTSFADAWRYCRESVLHYPAPQECEGCQYLMQCPPCVAQHRVGAPKGHANPMLCDRVRRFIAEGFVEFLGNQ